MKNNPDLITWSNTFSCGIKLIDDQHKELVDLVNEMFHHSTGNDIEEREYFNKVIQKTVYYIKIHFATEEKLMRAVKYPGFIEHKRAHDIFVLSVIDNIRNYEIEKHHTLYTFTKLLKEWVLSHIAVMDKQYFTYIRQIATVKADNKLSITLGDIN
jgi:hemerythrin